ncbi:SDR family NAD(P)-dependent oxidoreductase [Streptomyces sp. NPDC057702]|uniref:SDR family NAD(P)-dependent oxidoreductase n=1 Tax=unclassified Streptomyces TaxID=2593676 RepID=UPI003673D3A4
MPGAVVIGAGPGIGQAVARRFAREGLPVALVARSRRTLDEVAREVQPVADAAAGDGARPGASVAALIADVTDEAALRAALDAAADRFGPPDVVVYNAAVVRSDRVGELDARAHLDAWAVNVVGAHTAAAHVAPGMARRGSGTFLVTSGMPQTVREFVSLSLGKAGVRALVSLLDQEYGPAGVHVAAVTVDGPVAPGTAFDPDAIAEHYWRLHTQPRAAWERDVLFAGDPVA